LWKVEARLALALGCSPERLLIAFDSGWYRETARSTCFLSWGSRLQLSINERARELPYTFIFSLARRGVSCGGSPRSASEILNRLNEVSVNAVLLKELLRQVADPGNREGAQRAGRRNPPHCERDADRARHFVQTQRGMGWQNCSIAARNI
jgi:hypothetical protein